MRNAHITGWGMYAPERIVTNNELAQRVDTSDSWIVSRTGIQERRVCADGESTSHIAVKAALAALKRAGRVAAQVDMIILATCTPDHLMPSAACLVQERLGATKASAFDINAACSGFIYALSIARNAIVSGESMVSLVIGADTLMSSFIDWEDRATCVLFGDGAGAVVLEAREEEGGILTSVLGSDGAGAEKLIIPGGGSLYPPKDFEVHQQAACVAMNGPEVFRFATRTMGRATKEAVSKAGLEMDDVQLIIPHQANKRIIVKAAEHLEFPTDQVFMNLHKYGNTSAASIPIAICEAVEKGSLRPGDKVVLVGFGAGLTWAATVVQWRVPPKYTGIDSMRRNVRHWAAWTDVLLLRIQRLWDKGPFYWRTNKSSARRLEKKE